ncbi:MAG: hypothetical protein JWO06_2692 [Bacteroidota bacterium]|nr:hypothetical protein [Bacteroidota bacterium]
MSSENIDNIISFVAGNLATMIITWPHFSIVFFAAKITMVLLVGFLGGAAGLAGKDFYQWLKKKF